MAQQSEQTVYKYRVRCTTEGKNVFTWAETEPTKCPNNDGHTIDSSKTTIVGRVKREFPVSQLDNTKVAVHSSPKPIVLDKTTYAVWAGAGDLVDGSPIPESNIGMGDLLSFSLEPGTSSQTVDVKFDPAHGGVWIHEGYVKFENAGHGDYLTGDVMASATVFQPYVDLIGDLDEDNWFVPTPPGSPYAPTYGFGATPVLVPRTFSKDGDWDYDEETESLTPNFTKTGGYKISSIERVVHRYANRVPACGTAGTYFIMSSDETTELPADYFVRITAYNVSNTTWMATVFLEIYRERTYVP